MLHRILVTLFAFQTVASAQLSKFQARTQKGQTSGLNLGYRLFTPAGYDKAKKYPLVIALHGSGERGNNNTAQITANQLANIWTEDSLQNRVPHFVMAPQCPGESTWVQYNKPLAGRPLSGSLKIVLEIVDSLAREFNLDADRVYCVGLSMGGFATWELAQRYPDKFAAIVPICGWADTSKAALIKALPTWAFHGGSDPTVPVAGSRDMIAALRAAGGSPKYTEYPGVGHESWVPALKEKELSPWLFAQKRTSATGLSQKAPADWSPAGRIPGHYPWQGQPHALDGRQLPATGISLPDLPEGNASP